jgi:hypothetical protein
MEPYSIWPEEGLVANVRGFRRRPRREIRDGERHTGNKIFLAYLRILIVREVGAVDKTVCADDLLLD